MTFLCVIICPFFLGKTSTSSAPEQNSEPQKVYAHDALTNAYIQCVENKMPVRRPWKGIRDTEILAKNMKGYRIFL